MKPVSHLDRIWGSLPGAFTASLTASTVGRRGAAALRSTCILLGGGAGDDRPHDPAAAGGDRLRAGHADREQVIEALKNAFVHGRLTKDELDTRAAQALAARTYADLAALTADIPPAPAPAAPARPAVPAARPLARAAAGSGGCLVIAFAAMQVHRLADPGNTPGTLPGSLALPSFLVAITAVFAALLVVIYGVGTAVEQRRSRRQLPPRPGAGGHALEGERCRDTGGPGPRTGQNRADLGAFSRRGPAARSPSGSAGHGVAPGRRRASSDLGQNRHRDQCLPLRPGGAYLLSPHQIPA